MTDFTLIIANKNYSSWSLRPWLLMRHAGIPFKEIKVPLYTEGSKAEVLRYSPTGKVPVLQDGAITLWESIAICEYIAEKYPQKALWPRAADARAVARTVSAEMHAGFADLRRHMGMNCRKSLPGKGRAPGVQEDIDRVRALWNDCRRRFGHEGAFLFGAFSVADAMFAPVVWRFLTYEVTLDAVSAAYVQTLRGLPAMQAWYEDALTEPVVPRYEQ